MDRGHTESINQLCLVDPKVPTEATVIKDVMKFIPHEDNWEKEYFEGLKQQRKRKIADKKRKLGWQKKKKKTLGK